MLRRLIQSRGEKELFPSSEHGATFLLNENRENNKGVKSDRDV